MNEKTMWEMWGCWNAFRNLGFLADQIFAKYAIDGDPSRKTLGKPCGFVELRAQGKIFDVCCGEVEQMTKEEFFKLWNAQGEKANALSDAELGRRWKSSLAHAEGAAMVIKMVAKGFRITKRAN